MDDKNYNTGQNNTGNWNTGDNNSGYWNAGHGNTGHRNTSDSNSGNWNTSYSNTGDANSGYWNAGHSNTGHRNTGDSNTGYWNSGHRNTGDWNSGSWNVGHRNTGYCNSVTPEECLIFNKPAKIKEWRNATKPRWMYVKLNEWVPDYEMTDKEKEAHPSYVRIGGYLKCYPDLKTAYVEAWENTTDEDRELTKKLPNFDPDVFEEVFGFNPFKEDED